MPKERTEAEILSRAPIKAKLGEKEFDLPILPVLKMAAWRRKMFDVANEFGSLGVSLASVGITFSAFPEKMLALIVAYAPEVLEGQIDDATDEQIAETFSSIIPVAFPFLRQLSLMKSVLMASQSVSERSTSSSSTSTSSPQIM